MAAPIARTEPAVPPPAEPIFLGDARPRFACQHRPAGTPRGTLVIVYEAICAHRALRHRAETAARAGTQRRVVGRAYAAFAVLATFAVAALSYHADERRFLALKASLAPKRSA